MWCVCIVSFYCCVWFLLIVILFQCYSGLCLLTRKWTFAIGRAVIYTPGIPVQSRPGGQSRPGRPVQSRPGGQSRAGGQSRPTPSATDAECWCDCMSAYRSRVLSEHSAGRLTTRPLCAVSFVSYWTVSCRRQRLICPRYLNIHITADPLRNFHSNRNFILLTNLNFYDQGKANIVDL